MRTFSSGSTRGNAEWRESTDRLGDEPEGRGAYWAVGFVAVLIIGSVLSAIFSVAGAMR